jgi:hypothetical protein
MINYLKYILLFLLTSLLGAQTTYAKKELILSQNQVSFLFDKNQNFKSQKKEVQPNIGFLKEKDKFVAVQLNLAVNPHNFSEQHLHYLANAGSELIRGVRKSDFIESVGEFATNPQLVDDAWLFFRNEDWTALENLINTNNINGGWPPNNGFKNITNVETGSELSGKTFDRFQIDEDLGGGFASPVNSGEEVGDLVFTYDSRALKYQISEGTYYIKFKLKNNIPSDLKFEYGEAIPWFNASGNANQIKSSYNFGNLTEGVDYDIIERLVYQNGQWVTTP